jgi:hypothetical protein
LLWQNQRHLLLLVKSNPTIDMEFLTTLWLPILLSAVFVFIVSSVIHMVLGYHASDYQKVPNEDQVIDKLRDLNIPPGHYSIPKAESMKNYNSPEFQARLAKGPNMMISVHKPGVSMSSNLIKWFGFLLLVNIFVAYVSSHTISPGTEYLKVHQVAGCVAFMGYGLGLFQDAIWGGKSWGATWKMVFDALVYGLVTGGTFGWLWQ